MTLVYSLLALVGGALFPIQASINAMLGRQIGGAVPATIVSFVVGLAALVVVHVLVLRGTLDVAGLRSASPWLFVGGLLGATFLGLSVFLVPRIGTGALLCLVVAGQIATSMVIDSFGLFGVPARETSIPQIMGAVLVVTGVILVRFR